MALFEGPEYASFIALCRELRLERVYWQPGDLRWHPRANPSAWPGQIMVISDSESAEAASIAGNREAVWLPRLDQLLAMLEEAGARSLTLEPLPPDEDHPTATWNCAGRGAVGVGRTREEAAARLWLAVTGRQLTA